jgi:hypothetical protein
MKAILVRSLTLIAVLAQPAIAGTVAAVPSPKLDALTRGRSTTEASTVTTEPTVRKSSSRMPPKTAAPTTGAPPLAPATNVAAPPDTSPAAKVRPKLYAGTQLGDSIVGVLIGLQLNKKYAVEARYDYLDTLYLPNGNTKSSIISAAGIALFPLSLSNLEPFDLYAKVGYERNTLKTTVVDPGIPPFPATTTTTTTVRGRVLLGGGIQYQFGDKVNGRVGMNFIGSDHSIYIAALYKF